MTDRIGDDLLSGAQAIADEINQTLRQTRHKLENGHLPGFKLGGIWHARRSTIRKRFEELESAGK